MSLYLGSYLNDCYGECCYAQCHFAKCRGVGKGSQPEPLDPSAGRTYDQANPDENINQKHAILFCSNIIEEEKNIIKLRLVHR